MSSSSYRCTASRAHRHCKAQFYYIQEAFLLSSAEQTLHYDVQTLVAQSSIQLVLANTMVEPATLQQRTSSSSQSSSMKQCNRPSSISVYT
eukprot:19902-Heterococcus_DN1.PRE.1